MDPDISQLCIVCCRPFELSGQAEHAEKISKLLEDIKSSGSSQVDEFWKQVNFCEELEQLEKSFDLSFCSDCLVDLNKLLETSDKMSLLENHVISLQRQILKGLREIEECQEMIRGHREKIRTIVDKSDVSCLKRRCLSDVNQRNGNGEDSNHFALKLRQWILQDGLQYKERKLKGSLSISPTEENKRQISVKVEVEPEVEDDDHLGSNSFWDTDTEPELRIKTDLQENSNQEETKCEIKNTSTRTLRKRMATKPNDQLKSTLPSPSKKPRFVKTKSRKKSSTKKITKLLVKPVSKKSTSPKTVGVRAALCCELCPFTTNNLPGFEQHLKGHEDPNSNVILKCPQCPSQFSTNQYLQFHQKLHQDSYKMCCDICSQFVPVLGLQHHLQSHFPLNPEIPTTTPPPKLIFCQNCSFCCTTPHAYVNHCRRHYVSKTARFPCSICTKQFTSTSKLIHHYTQIHKDIVHTWSCDVQHCSKIFPSKDSMLIHKRKIHGIKIKTVSCADPNCDKMFSSIQSMNVHFCLHSGEKPFPCDLCEERYPTKEGVIKHQRRVHGAAKPTCKICGVDFFDPGSLKAHIAQHENKGLPCKICGKIFWNKLVLKEHLWTHSEVTRWTCEQCGKGFKTRCGWKGHKAMHEEKKNWKCEYCGKGFVRSSNLQDHLRVHTGERPYICDVCGKDFNQASALRIHRKKLHQ